MLEPARLFDVTSGARTEVTPVITADGFVNVLSLAEAPAPGTRFVLESPAPSTCIDAGAKPLNTEFTITASAPMPDTLGQLSAAVELDMLTVPTRAGSCSVKIEAAYADLALAFADAAKPFVNVIEYQFLLDGEPTAPFTDSLSGGHRRPRGEERVYAPCGNEAHLDGASTLGIHRAKFRGTLPSGASIESEEVEFELTCNSATTTVSEDAGAPSSPDAGPAEQADAAVEADAAVAVEVAVAQEPPRTAAATTDEAGCSVTRRLGSGAPAWLSVVAALMCSLVLRTRRARRARSDRAPRYPAMTESPRRNGGEWLSLLHKRHVGAETASLAHCVIDHDRDADGVERSGTRPEPRASGVGLASAARRAV